MLVVGGVNAPLPIELNNRILEYAGKIKWRNGKYVGQIPKDDERYAILRTIPLKIGGPCMMYSEMCYISWVSNNNNNNNNNNSNNNGGVRFDFYYYENHPHNLYGEILLQYSINDSNYIHYIGNKYPPLWYPTCFTREHITGNKKWVDYDPDD